MLFCTKFSNMQLLDTSTFWVFNWYYLAAVTISGTALIFAIKNYKKKSKSLEPQINNQLDSQISSINTLTVNFPQETSKFVENINPTESTDNR